MLTIATRLAAASAAGIVSGIAAISMIFASPAPNPDGLNCTKVHCVAAGFTA